MQTADQDLQTLQNMQNAVSDQGQYGLLTGISMQNTIKANTFYQKPLKQGMDSSK